jgi:fructose-1,6-bisphosphatase I
MSLEAVSEDKLNSMFKAGGIATTGTKRILDIIPKSIHERCSVFLGSKDDVQDLMKFYREVAED